jgi:hypothetical protein
MESTVQQALDALKSLGTPEEMDTRAKAGKIPAERPKVNAHIHLPPNFSAFESVAQAVDLAASQDVRVLGVSNYYDYRVYGNFVTEARQRGIFPLFGLEIIALDEDLKAKGIKMNDPGNPGKLYICGKGITHFDQMTPKAVELLGLIRRNDSERMRHMILRLAEVFSDNGLATGIDEDKVIDMVVRRHDCGRDSVYLQERHLCQAFQEALYEQVPSIEELIPRLETVFDAPSKAKSAEDTVTIQNEIRSHLMKAGKPAFVAETFVNIDQAYRLILELGGIPCYPVLADGADPISPFEQPVDQLVENIRSSGIHMAEFIPIRNDVEVLREYVSAVRSAGLPVVAGTEHNTLSLIPIEPACLNGVPVPDDIQEIFWEGACVVAAHQFLNLHGLCGYVVCQGQLSKGYFDEEERITALSTLGAAVIESYFETVR